MGRALASLLVVPVVAAAAASARADDILVPGDFRSLQDAVDVAEPGDRVLVTGGRHRGSVVIATQDVTVEGDGVVLRGRRGEAAIVVVAEGVTVRGFTFRGSGVLGLADDVTVERNRFSGTRDRAAVRVEGAGARVRLNGIERVRGGRLLSFDNAASGISVEGHGASVTDNAVSDVVRGDGITVTGDGAIVEGNLVDFVAAGFGLRVEGDDCLVSDNACTGVGRLARFRFRAGGGGAVDPSIGGGGGGGGGARWVMTSRICPGIVVLNDDGTAVVTGNAVEHGASDGFDLRVDGAEVSGNVEVFTGDEFAFARGMLVDGDAVLVEGNVLDGGPLEIHGRWSDQSGAGLPSGNVVTGNVIRDQGVGSMAAVHLAGDGNAFDGNLVENSLFGGVMVMGSRNVLADNDVHGARDPGAWGIQIGWGDDNVLAGNETTGMTDSGIVICPQILRTEVVECVSTGNGGCGLDNGGSSTEVLRSTFTGNGVQDVRNTGDLSVFDGNVLGAIGGTH